MSHSPKLMFYHLLALLSEVPTSRNIYIDAVGLILEPKLDLGLQSYSVTTLSIWNFLAASICMPKIPILGLDLGMSPILTLKFYVSRSPRYVGGPFSICIYQVDYFSTTRAYHPLFSTFGSRRHLPTCCNWPVSNDRCEEKSLFGSHFSKIVRFLVNR